MYGYNLFLYMYITYVNLFLVTHTLGQTGGTILLAASEWHFLAKSIGRDFYIATHSIIKQFCVCTIVFSVEGNIVNLITAHRNIHTFINLRVTRAAQSLAGPMQRQKCRQPSSNDMFISLFLKKIDQTKNK